MDMERINTYLAAVDCSFHETSVPVDGPLRVGVDLGTASIVLVALDAENHPIASERREACVVKDGVVVDYFGAIQIVRELKAKLEKRLNTVLSSCAIAMPGNTENSAKVHQYVVESAGFTVTNVLDEPSAANSVLQLRNGAVVDIGGGTTGIAVLQNRNVVLTDDEPTGGVHLSLVLAGHCHISLEEAEKMKQDAEKHSDVFPLVIPVLEKMSFIVERFIKGQSVDQVALCGGTCCLKGMEAIFEKRLEIPVFKPENPLLVTPAGIAMNCR